MKKHGWLAALVLITSAPVSALDRNCYDGFYSGASVGYSTFISKLRNDRQALILITNSGTGVVDTETFNQGLNTHTYKNSPIGSVYLGYGKSCENFYIGAEGFVSISKKTGKFKEDQPTVSTTITGAGVTTIINQNFPALVKVKSRFWELGLDIRPGILLCADTLLYGRVGLTQTRIRVNSQTNFVSDDANLGGTFNLNTTRTSKKNRILPRFGLGLEKMICANLSIRGDYIYTYYGRAKSRSSSRSFAALPAGGGFAARTVDGLLTDDSKTKSHQHAFMLGLSYYWS